MCTSPTKEHHDRSRARAGDHTSLGSLLQFVFSHKLAVANFELDIHVLSCGGSGLGYVVEGWMSRLDDFR